MVDETDPRKGRATPSRKEAEAARKKQMKTPMTRKESAKRERSAREEIRGKQREALKTGDEKYLPARERGPERRFARDFVDRRWNFAEFLLPFLLVIVVVLFVTSGISTSISTVLTAVVYPFVIVGTVLDEIVLVRGLRKELRARFTPENTRGAVMYAILRSSQLRRFRLPKVQVKRGEALAPTYR